MSPSAAPKSIQSTATCAASSRRSSRIPIDGVLSSSIMELHSSLRVPQCVFLSVSVVRLTCPRAAVLQLAINHHDAPASAQPLLLACRLAQQPAVVPRSIRCRIFLHLPFPPLPHMHIASCLHSPRVADETNRTPPPSRAALHRALKKPKGTITVMPQMKFKTPKIGKFVEKPAPEIREQSPVNPKSSSIQLLFHGE